MYPNCILIFRGKEHYVMYQEDAKEASIILGLTLIKSNRDGLYQAGFAPKDLDYYISKLRKVGKRVLLCDIFVKEYYYI